jgi:hypothetical protein
VKEEGEKNENMSKTEMLVRRVTAGMSGKELKEFAKDVSELNEKMTREEQH